MKQPAIVALADLGVTILTEQIKDVAIFVGSTWNAKQVAMTIALMHENYSWFTLAELKQFLSRVFTGHYESNKNLTPPLFMEHAASYAAEMLGVRYRHFSEQKPKGKFVIKYEQLNIRARQRAAFDFLCKRDAELRAINMQRLTSIAETIEAFSKKAQAEDKAQELRTKNLDKLDRHKQMRDVIEIAMSAGYAPDRAVYIKYLQTIEKIKEITAIL